MMLADAGKGDVRTGAMSVLMAGCEDVRRVWWRLRRYEEEEGLGWVGRGCDDVRTVRRVGVSAEGKSS